MKACETLLETVERRLVVRGWEHLDDHSPGGGDARSLGQYTEEYSGSDLLTLLEIVSERISDSTSRDSYLTALSVSPLFSPHLHQAATYSSGVSEILIAGGRKLEPWHRHHSSDIAPLLHLRHHAGKWPIA
jgi:hypothetical protein